LTGVLLLDSVPLMKVTLADRLGQLPPYLFAEIDRMKQEQIAKGADVISLGIGDPDRPTPLHIVEALQKAVTNTAYHQYPSYQGMLSFREAAAQFMQDRFSVSLDPKCEVVSLIGSKEAVAHIPLAFVNPGDAVLYTDPGYPVYQVSTVLAGGQPHPVSLLADNDFLPDFSSIPEEVAAKAKLFFINYPNNPISKLAPDSFFEELIAFAKKHEIIVVSDMAYSEFYPEGQKPQSLLQFEGGKDVGIEFHSLSKTYNMTGWRIAFAVGHPDIVAGLGKIKTNIDSGIFGAIQEAGSVALTGDQSCVDEMRTVYARRRKILDEAISDAGLKLACSEGAFYIWVHVPDGYTSAEFVKRVIEEAHVVCTPGNGFGPAGEGYLRFTLTAADDRLEEAGERIARLKL
jgi:LL-diaminopimelate aminotransferase